MNIVFHYETKHFQIILTNAKKINYSTFLSFQEIILYERLEIKTLNLKINLQVWNGKLNDAKSAL